MPTEFSRLDGALSVSDDDATFTLDSFKGIKNGMKYMLDLYNVKCSVKPLPAKF